MSPGARALEWEAREGLGKQGWERAQDGRTHVRRKALNRAFSYVFPRVGELGLSVRHLLTAHRRYPHASRPPGVPSHGG